MTENEEFNTTAEFHTSLGETLWEAVERLDMDEGKCVVFPIKRRDGFVQVIVSRDRQPCANRQCRECYPDPPPDRLHVYEPSEVEKLQRQVDDLIRTLARVAR